MEAPALFQSKPYVFCSGTYDITLAATTSAGCNGTVTHTGLVTVDPFPTASFNLVSDTGCVPFTAQFNNTSSNSASWFWDFGDGGTSTDQNPNYTYTSNGKYDVTLIAYSANGCADTILISNAVELPSIHS